MSGPYLFGNTVRLSDRVTLYGTTTLVDPTTVTCTVKQPDGTLSTPAVVKDGVGLYHADFNPTQSGAHMYQFVGSGLVETNGERTFTVKASAFA